VSKKTDSVIAGSVGVVAVGLVVGGFLYSRAHAPGGGSSAGAYFASTSKHKLIRQGEGAGGSKDLFDNPFATDDSGSQAIALHSLDLKSAHAPL
jgi:hypothetical protein